MLGKPVAVALLLLRATAVQGCPLYVNTTFAELPLAATEAVQVEDEQDTEMPGVALIIVIVVDADTALFEPSPEYLTLRA